MKTKFLTSFIFLTFSLSTSAQWLQLGLDIEGDSLDNYFGFSGVTFKSWGEGLNL